MGLYCSLVEKVYMITACLDGSAVNPVAWISHAKLLLFTHADAGKKLGGIHSVLAQVIHDSQAM